MGWRFDVAKIGKRISNLRYANYTTLLTASETELAGRIENESELVGLKINKAKTKVMIV